MENSHIELTSTWACSTVFTGLFLYDAVMNCPEITITASAKLYTVQDMLIFLLSIQDDIKINNLPSAVFIALMPVKTGKCMKQII